MSISFELATLVGAVVAATVSVITLVLNLRSTSVRSVHAAKTSLATIESNLWENIFDDMTNAAASLNLRLLHKKNGTDLAEDQLSNSRHKVARAVIRSRLFLWKFPSLINDLTFMDAAIDEVNEEDFYKCYRSFHEELREAMFWFSKHSYELDEWVGEAEVVHDLYR